MYFKDNAGQLTSSGLLLWFVVIPLLLLSAIMTILWWQKKREKQINKASDTVAGISGEKESIKTPDTYHLFIYSRICLPEGDCWSEVVDNDEDFTVLSDNLVDIDGLPLLIKPITRLTDAASLPYVYMSDTYGTNSDFDDSYSNSHDDNETFEEADTDTDRMAAPDSTTLRLYSLVHELLTLGDDILSTLAEYFHQHYKQHHTQSNSAIHIHPEWQQHYLIGANEESDDDIMPPSSHASLSELPIYLCIPASADSTFLIAAVKEQLATYAIPETLISITPIVTDDTDVARDMANSTVTCDPTEFINEHLMSLSQSADPKLCVMLIADSQINDGWLDAHLSPNHNANIIPTEAGTLLVFFNKAAQDVLDIDTKASVLLTEIGTPTNRNDDSDKRRYFNHLTTIKNLLIDNDLSLSPTSTVDLEATKKSKTQLTESKYKTNVSLSDMTLTAISDINPSIQLYDISVYINFLEAFIAQDTLVNEHHLGHYMPLNTWLKPFISLSLFVESSSENQQESEKSFLITQHKQCSVLWLTDVSEALDP